MNTVAKVLGALLPMTLAACCSIMDPGPDMVPVRSEPAGATVKVDGVPSGKTPCVVAIQRKAPGVLALELEGYQPLKVERPKQVSPYVILDFFTDLCTISLIIDIAAGNSTRHSHNPLDVVLRKEGEGISEVIGAPASAENTSRAGR